MASAEKAMNRCAHLTFHSAREPVTNKQILSFLENSDNLIRILNRAGDYCAVAEYKDLGSCMIACMELPKKSGPNGGQVRVTKITSQVKQKLRSLAPMLKSEAKPLKKDEKLKVYQEVPCYLGPKHHKVDGKVIEFKHRGLMEYQTSFQIFCKNLPTEMLTDDLREFLKLGGETSWCVAHKHNPGEGVASFITRQDMKNCVNVMNGKRWKGSAITLEYLDHRQKDFDKKGVRSGVFEKVPVCFEYPDYDHGTGRDDTSPSKKRKHDDTVEKDAKSARTDAKTSKVDSKTTENLKNSRNTKSDVKSRTGTNMQDPVLLHENCKGVISKYNTKSKFGFLVPDDKKLMPTGESMVFVHFRDVRRGVKLLPGLKVKFDMKTLPAKFQKRNKTVGAYDVRPVNWGDEKKEGSVPCYDDVLAKDKMVEEEILKNSAVEDGAKDTVEMFTDEWEVIEIKSDNEKSVEEDENEENEETEEKDESKPENTETADSVEEIENNDESMEDDAEFSALENDLEVEEDTPFFGEPEEKRSK